MNNFNFLKPLYFLLVICLWLQITSCSIGFEKRRYRPGYHVDMVKNHSIRSSNQYDQVSGINKKDNSTQLLLKKGPDLELKVIDPVISNNNKEKSSNTVKNSNKTLHPTNFHLTHGGKKAYHINKTKSLKGKKTAAWVLGGLSMAVAVVGIGLSFIGYGGIGIVVLGICLGIAALFAAIALIVRYAGAKKFKDEEPPPYKPIDEKYINGSFVFSIISIGLALISLIFSFIIYPFGIAAISLGAVAAVAAIISFSLGFRALKDDKSLKTKLIIIFGFIALILVILAFLLVFL